MNLTEYLSARFKTQREAAEFFGVTPGLVSHWMTGRRLPSTKKAKEIVCRTGGAITLDQIYQSPDKVTPVSPAESSGDSLPS
jgi:DNA-binding transcriptional regulator YdaS (Cro superfamily)